MWIRDSFTLIVAAYVITGGIKGVLYTDALQAVIMFACMLFLLFWFYHIMDMGFIEANQKLTDIAPMVPERFKALGHQGWTAMPISCLLYTSMEYIYNSIKN